MGFFDASYGESDEEEDVVAVVAVEKEDRRVDVDCNDEKKMAKSNTKNSLPSPLDFLGTKQEASFLSGREKKRDDASDDEEDEMRGRTTKRAREDKSFIRRDAVLTTTTRAVVLEENSAERRDGEATPNGGRRNNQKNQRAAAAAAKETVKERERKKRQMGQNGRDAKEWKSEGEMLLRQQYD